VSSDRDRRLRRALDGPRSGGDVEERALATALAALPARRPRRQRALVLAAAATLAAATVAAAGALAAGTLHVSLGKPVASPATRTVAARTSAARLVVPAGAHGIAAVVDGRLWLTTADGVRIEGLRVTSAELSPRALYVAAGIGRTLVAMAPDGRRAWAYPTGGSVAAIAWAPSGLEIAYVVRRRGGFELRLIEGDGDHDRLLDAEVRPVRPSWRADSLALAYVGAGGRAVVYDLGHERRAVVRDPARATAVAYAPAGSRLAVASRTALIVDGARSAGAVPSVAGLAWTGAGLAVAVRPAEGAAYVRMPDGARVPVPGSAVALAAAGDRVVVAVRGSRRELRLLASSPPGTAPPRLDRRLLVVPAAGSVESLIVR
jgi:hypothetical protein